MRTLVKFRYAPAHSAPPIPVQFPRIMSVRGQRTKRVFDLIVAVILSIAGLPLAGLIALAIRMESGGPILFGHMRIGHRRRRFRVWKFRTMVGNSEEMLERHLADNPAAAVEWELTQKLRDDPRITRVGRFLRRTSLDELPQLWNILRGDMSVVGPRPIVDEEVGKYGSAFQLYANVRPGLTGLWQVSGRNNTSYGRRVHLDADYIRNWSVGLDLRILCRTGREVVAGRGAY
jgi:Undecaprenyl-phosphate galactose phosphotransferase WbaP